MTTKTTTPPRAGVLVVSDGELSQHTTEAMSHLGMATAKASEIRPNGEWVYTMPCAEIMDMCNISLGDLSRCLQVFRDEGLSARFEL